MSVREGRQNEYIPDLLITATRLDSVTSARGIEGSNILPCRAKYSLSTSLSGSALVAHPGRSGSLS